MQVQSNFYVSFKKKKKHNNLKHRANGSPLLCIDKNNSDVVTLEYSKPVSLKKALYDIRNDFRINEGIVGYKEIVARFINDFSFDPKNKKILKRKVTKLIGYGCSAAVFETADGKILKITDGNHIPMHRPHAEFDVPIFKQGKAGKTHFYLEEKLYQHNIPYYWVDIVKDMIKKAGYKPKDLYECDIHQIGISENGKIYLLDAECAVYKTLLHALCDKLKRLICKFI